METTSVRANEISRDWFVVDAKGQILGRLASEIAQILRGSPFLQSLKIRANFGRS